MGTKSTVKFYVNKECLCSIYQQYDGYIEGVGEELKDFIKSKEFVNGIPYMGDDSTFNGVGCFIAQYIATHKNKAGGLYITNEKDTQEFNYEVHFPHLYEYSNCIVKETSGDYPEFDETIVI